MPWQGQGFAGEAATALVQWLREQGVPAITANIHPDHHASAGVAARAGLTVTAEEVDGERVWRFAEDRPGRDSAVLRYSGDFRAIMAG